MRACVRCKREDCRADALGRIAVLLGFPDRMRLKVTTEQDECDYAAKRLKEKS